MSMEISHRLRKRLWIELIINAKVLAVRDVVLVFYYNSGLVLKRHREIAIQSRTTPETMTFLWFAGNRQRQRRIIARDRVADSKEIS
jgi:hypothetical protein